MEWNKFEEKKVTEDGFYVFATENKDGEYSWWDYKFRYITYPETGIERVIGDATLWFRIEQPTK